MRSYWKVAGALGLAAIAATAIAAAPAGGVGGNVSDGEPAALTKPVAEYSGEEFLALVESVEWLEGETARLVCDGAECATLRIDAVAEPHQLSWRERPHGVVVSRYVVENPGVDHRGMSFEADHEYYFVATPGDDAAAGRTRLVALDVSGASPRLQVLARSGTIGRCNDHGRKAGFPARMGVTCDNAHTVDVSMGYGPASARVVASDDPTWFTCDGTGCCNVVTDPPL